ncbi:neutral ceramidase-like [Ptychodera flava]|uniref:neutral ceramidase-like n=1 Tax=Ptychodera flava TaxID=63121 RepID=UPI00396A38D0
MASVSATAFLVTSAVFVALLYPMGIHAADPRRQSGPSQTPQLYKIGVGIADITGPAAETNMMGYASPSQTTRGIHFRLFSRAYIVADHDDDSKRFVFVNADIAMGAQIVKLEVIKRLDIVHPGLYTDQNIAFSGQHTHSGPAGYQQYLLYDITSLGFLEDSFEAIVEGLEKSILRAHNNLQSGYVYINKGEVIDPSGVDKHWANRNRSPYAYEANPQEEKDKYEYDVDKMMTLLKFVAEDGKDLGALTWFAVHTTSMNNTNRLISGDNKGYASYLMERHFNGGARPGTGEFVAAFAQSNNGDVTPNTKDPHCLDAGEDSECEYETSKCPGQDVCVAFGPGEDMFQNTEIIGRRQFDKAMELYESADTPLTGDINFKTQYVDMSSYEVHLPGGTVTTCKPAMGYSFAAGTIDGPGAFNFTQGDTTGDPFWDRVRDFLKEPSEELKACHAPKPILLPTGEATNDWDWHPTIIDTQILTIGSFVILAVPGEFSTMAGRRIRDSVKEVFTDNGYPAETEVVIAGLSNVYTHYITTIEEYGVQRYEAASTIYGPHTLEAYQQQYGILADAIARNLQLDPGPSPPNFIEEGVMFGIRLPVIQDDLPLQGSFGDVVVNAEEVYEAGDTVTVTFQSGNPRNDIKLEGTYLEVQRANDFFEWETVYTDADWCTRFHWISSTRRLLTDVLEFLLDLLRDPPPLLPIPPLPIPTAIPSLPIPINITLPENFSLPELGIPGTGESLAEIVWEIPGDAPIGVYRICHYGTAMTTDISIVPPGLSRELQPYQGCSRSFDVTEGGRVITEPPTVRDSAWLNRANNLVILSAVITAILFFQKVK